MLYSEQGRRRVGFEIDRFRVMRNYLRPNEDTCTIRPSFTAVVDKMIIILIRVVLYITYSRVLEANAIDYRHTEMATFTLTVVLTL